MNWSRFCSRKLTVRISALFVVRPWMAHCWMGHSLFLTISVGDHNLANGGFYSFTGGKNTKTQFQMIATYTPLHVSYSIIAFGVV